MEKYRFLVLISIGVLPTNVIPPFPTSSRPTGESIHSFVIYIGTINIRDARASVEHHIRPHAIPAETTGQDPRDAAHLRLQPGLQEFDV